MKLKRNLEQICVLLMVSLSVLGLLVLASCQSTGRVHGADRLTDPSDLNATRIAGDRSVFELPAAATTQTSREDLFRLVDALDEAYERLDFAAPFPRIRIVDWHDPVLKGQAIGVAAIAAGDEERIYLNRQYLSTHAELMPLILHELAHLKAWRVHGHAIAPHGREFMAICHSVTAVRNCTARE